MAKDKVFVFPTKLEATHFKHIYYLMKGIGKVYAAMAATELIDAGYKKIILLGTCAATDKTPVGTAIVANQFYEWDMDCTALGYILGCTPYSRFEKTPTIETKFKSMIRINQPCKRAAIMSGDRFVTDKELPDFAKYVDMESAAMAKVCREHKIEFLSIKVVSDNADKNSKNNWAKNALLASKILNEIKII
jgi:adenosylhomocysteine nucleosidase